MRAVEPIMFSKIYRDQKLIDHFIYADGIDIQFFRDHHSRYLGQDVGWKFCTHMSNVCTLYASQLLSFLIARY